MTFLVNEVQDCAGPVKTIDWQPGNGTSYKIIAVKIRDGEWVVSVPNFGSCMFVSEGMSLSIGYLAEKLVRRHKLDYGEGDLQALAAGISKLVPHCHPLELDQPRDQ